MLNLEKYKNELNINLKFQKAFLKELGKLGVIALIESTEEGRTGGTQDLSQNVPNSLFQSNFTTTDVSEWPKQYQYYSTDHCFGFLTTDDGEEFSLVKEFRKLEQRTGVGVVDQAATEALDLNQYGFPNDWLKSPTSVGRGENAHEELTWDFNKFSDVLVANLHFVTWEKRESTGNEVTRYLFLYTDEKGYRPFNDDDMQTLLKTIGVPDDKVKTWGKDLTKLVKNHQNVLKFSEWNTSLIACKNVVLDPWTLNTRPHSPNDLVKERLKATWNPEAKHEMVDKLFEPFPDPDDRNMLKAALAVTLVGNLRQNFFVQKGVSGTGKSTITDAWADTVLGGSLHTTFNAQHAFAGESSRFGCQMMDTALMAVCDDLTNQKITDDGIFKSLTGGNNISIQYKGKDAYTAKARAVVIINSNAIPNFEDKTGAILRRCRFINRDYDLRDRTFNLADYLDDEDFGSRLLYLVMKEFQNLIIRDKNTGNLTYELPPESTGALKMREEARNRGVSVLDPFEILLQEKRIIGKKRKDIDDDIADTYNEVVGYRYTPMANETLNNSLHSQGLQSGLRIQLYTKKDSIHLLQKGWSVRPRNVIAFSSLDPDEKNKWGLYAVRYHEVMTGEAVKRCNELAKDNPVQAQKAWDKFLEAYNFTIEMIRKYYPESVSVYEATRNAAGVAPELAFAVPVV